MRRFVWLLLISVWGSALADTTWASTDQLLKEDADTLVSGLIYSDDCGFTWKEAKAVVDGVLIRSRLKPKGSTGREESLLLVVRVGCIQSIYSIRVDFARWVPALNRRLFESIYFGHFGTGDADSVLETLKATVEIAVTDYLTANFDLSQE